VADVGRLAVSNNDAGPGLLQHLEVSAGYYNLEADSDDGEEKCLPEI